jgi:hypothetical protein
MRISEQDISGVTEVVWGSMLELDVRPCPMWASDVEDSRLVASVAIRGAWSGTVELACPPALVREAAAVVFGIAPEEASGAQLREAIAELTNMTAGNLKALLPEPCELGLPAVADEDGAAEGSPGDAGTVTEAGFSCQGHPFFVRVVGNSPS